MEAKAPPRPSCCKMLPRSMGGSPLRVEHCRSAPSAARPHVPWGSRYLLPERSSVPLSASQHTNNAAAESAMGSACERSQDTLV